MMILYNWFLRLLVPVIILRLLWRGIRNPAYWRRWGERFGFVPRLSPQRRIWIHAVSVGEVRAAVPLVRALQAQHPGYEILLTTMTPTGSAQVQQLFSGQAAHCYVPYDLPSAVRRFLDRTQPDLALIMETEIWPTLFHACSNRFVPLIVANARMSENSMRRYLHFPNLTLGVLQQVTTFAAQSEADAERLRRLGADASRVFVTGSMKFEQKLPASLQESAEVLRREWGANRPIWIAASTHEGEEEQVLFAYTKLKRQLPALLLVLVPRHPERFAAVARLCRSRGYRAALRSEHKGPLPAETDIFIGDTMGELPLFFAAADVAFIGGSLVSTGGHNLLEASAVGVPVVFGPHMFNFDEISRMTLERAAGMQVHSAGELAASVGAYLIDPSRRTAAGEAGKKMVEENRGALDKTLALLGDFIKN